ncbi:MAG: SRPBCC domain-containing protein [Solirubrobacterales bacterium]|nr:SRPBCC domain-containing protein [Solirubrobacterales bacterium]
MSHDVRVARLIDGSPEEVFHAFTTPGGQEALYGQQESGWVVRSQCELRVGGEWTVDFGPSRRELYRHRHVFQVIDRPRRILASTTETRLDGTTLRFESEFRFEARGKKTLMTMTQRGLLTAELREEHRRGVPNALARLDRHLRLSRSLTQAQHDPNPLSGRSWGPRRR